jgi:hypothetical protein
MRGGERETWRRAFFERWHAWQGQWPAQCTPLYYVLPEAAPDARSAACLFGWAHSAWSQNQVPWMRVRDGDGNGLRGNEGGGMHREKAAGKNGSHAGRSKVRRQGRGNLKRRVVQNFRPGVSKLGHRSTARLLMHIHTPASVNVRPHGHSHQHRARRTYSTLQWRNSCARTRIYTDARTHIRTRTHTYTHASNSTRAHHLLSCAH